MTTLLPGGLSGVDAYRPFAQVRLIALDIDGTMAARPDERLAAQIRDLAATLSTYQVSLTLATGRAYAGARKFLESIVQHRSFERIGVPIIVYNGAVVVDSRPTRITLRHTIPGATIAEIIHIASNRNSAVLTYDCDSSYQTLLEDDAQPVGVTETVHGWTTEPGPTLDFNGLPIAWREPSEVSLVRPATAVLIVTSGTSQAIAPLRSELAELSGITVTSSSAEYIEVRPRGVDKGQALATVAQRLGLRAHQVLAVGDSENDVEMLKWARFGVVVGNASPAASRAAAYRSQRVAASAVVEILRVVAHARRYFRTDLGGGDEGLERFKPD